MLNSTPINAGSYKLVVKVSDETFAHTGSVKIPFTINKATLTVTAENKSIAFGMNAPEFTYKADGLVDGDTLSATFNYDWCHYLYQCARAKKRNRNPKSHRSIEAERFPGI